MHPRKNVSFVLKLEFRIFYLMATFRQKDVLFDFSCFSLSNARCPCSQALKARVTVDFMNMATSRHCLPCHGRRSAEKVEGIPPLSPFPPFPPAP